MSLVWVAAQRADRAGELADRTGAETSGTNACQLLCDHPVDVMVEASDRIWAAYHHARTALEQGSHVVLMNTEVDLVFGPLLARLAASRGLVSTSDAGDQHGVLARMIDEITLWGFKVVQAGNVKGFLNRHATQAELVEEAAKRNLALRKCCAFTDGTKLNIEMAVLANGFGYLPSEVGMAGPAITKVDAAMTVFDLESLAEMSGGVDYVLGAEPGGGVYVIARCDDPVQHPYLEYYKVGKSPFYLFKRDHHLCHLETTTAVGRAFLHCDPILQPWAGRVTEVYAFAKTNLTAGTEIVAGIGGDQFYGQIAPTRQGVSNEWVPIALLDSESDPARLERPLDRDAPLTWDHLPSFTSPMIDLYRTPDNHVPLG